MKTLLSISLGILLSVGMVSSQCSNLPWNDDNDHCATPGYPIQNHFSAYKEIRENGKTRHKCCPRPEKNEIEYFREQSQKCFPTQCIFEKGLSLADRCPNREINGRLYELETALTAPCTEKGQQGTQAQCCGKNSTEGVLLTRTGAEMNEFPHQAALSMGCGGTIYNKRFIITASHCIVDDDGLVMSASDITVTLGTNIGKYNDFHSDTNKYKVERVIHHEGYSRLRGKPNFPKGKMFNDIALLRLTEDIRFGPNIKALRIAPKGFVKPEQFSKYAVVIGWGTTDAEDTSQNLHKANVIIRSDFNCLGWDENNRNNGRDGFGPWGVFPLEKYEERRKQQLCLGGVMDGEYSSMAGGGDSGGPAICRDAQGYAVLCGVTSFGADDHNCTTNPNEKTCKPGVYSEVEGLREWIEKNTQYEGQDEKDLYTRKLYGEAVPQGEMEHQVHITSTNGKSCGGTLISNQVVLTAAQCLVRSVGKEKEMEGLTGVEIFVGQRDLNRQGENFGIAGAWVVDGFERQGDPIDVSKQRHGDFSVVVMTDNYHKNDLAIVKLDRPVGISQFPALPNARQTPSGLAMEVAFRRNSTFGSELQQREYRILKQDECQTRMNRMSSRIGAKVKVDKETICGVETYSGGSLCDRELGGGLICEGNVLCGVQNFRLCDTTIPNGFVNVAHYKTWIDKVLKQM